MRSLATVALVCATLTLAAPASLLRAQQVPYWPSEQRERLKTLDAELLTVQRQRFQALFFKKDDDAAKRLDQRFKEVQRERQGLLSKVDQ
jgi:hypothetical protein